MTSSRREPDWSEVRTTTMNCSAPWSTAEQFVQQVLGWIIPDDPWSQSQSARSWFTATVDDAGHAAAPVNAYRAQA
jgi:hypothetical protein